MKDLIQLMQEYRKIKGYADGGEVQDQSKLTKPKDVKAYQDLTLLDRVKQAIKGIDPYTDKSKNYADGGEVASPEEKAQSLPEDTDPSYIRANPNSDQDINQAFQDESENQPSDLESVEEPKEPVDIEKLKQMVQEGKESPEKPTQPEEKAPSEDRQSSLARLLAAVKPDSNGLAEAQKQRDQNIAGQQIMKGAMLLSAGAHKANPDRTLKVVGEQDKYVGLPVEKYKEQLENQQYDPNSPMTKTIEEYLKSKGLQTIPGTSAADYLKVMPFLAKDEALKTKIQQTMITQTNKMKEGEANRESREKVAGAQQKLYADRTKAMDERSKSVVGTRQDMQMQRRFDQLNKALREGGGQPVVQNRLAMQRANNLFLTNGVDPKVGEHDIDKIPDAKLNKINRINVIETGIELNRLLTGSGVAAQNTLNKLVPNNVNMTASQVQDYLTSKLNPAQQSQALKAYMKIAARVRDQSRTNVQGYQKQVLSGAGQIMDYFPEQSKMLLDEHELTPKDLKGAKKEAAPSTSNKGQINSSLLSDYATKHNISPEKAAEFLKGQGYGVEGY